MVPADLLVDDTYRATSFSAYSSSLVLKSLRVIFWPSFPARGEVFTLMLTPIRGASIFREGITF